MTAMDRTSGESTSDMQRAPPAIGWSLIIVAIYLSLIVVALWCFRTRRVMPAGGELSLPRCVFTVANSASLSGFDQTIPVESYKPLGQVVIFALIVAGSLTSMIVGSAAVARILGLPWSMGRIILSAVLVEALAVVVGSALLIGGGRDLFQACFQSASAFGNCGIVIGPVSGVDDTLTHLIILPLAVLGGLGLPVLLELFDSVAERRRFSSHARTVLAATAAIYLIGTVILMGLNWPRKLPQGSKLALELKSDFLQSSTTTLNSRSLGWPIESPARWPRTVAWIAMILMFIGASSAGTAGGLKTTTAVELGRGVVAALRGLPVARTFGLAAVWLGIFSLLILLTVLRLVVTEPQLPADQVLFIAISAASNVGIAFAPISITGSGLYWLSATMLLGRLLPLVMLWWAALTIRDGRVAVA